MNTATEHIAPEELMAWLDGELPGGEARAISTHVDECAECAAVADQFRGTARAMAQWTVPEAHSDCDGAILDAAKKVGSERAGSTRSTRFGVGNSLGTRWALGGAVFAVVLVVGFFAFIPQLAMHRMADLNPSQKIATSIDTGEVDSLAASSRAITEPKSELRQGETASSNGLLMPSAPPPPIAADSNGIFHGLEDHATGALVADSRNSSLSGPLIARTVSLTVLAKDFVTSRAALDGILTRHRGYSASLTVNTPASGHGSFQASLRIPATEVSSALADLKALGRVLTESQSGEEVTQQHADPEARLANSRETETRLRAMLAQRTGNVADVLQVEEEIARVRGQIEQMEAEQKALEHRVDFVSVDLNLTQEYREQLGQAGAAPSAGTRLHNSFVAGMRNAADTVLGFVLFLEEAGPTILIWLAILGVPALFFWRRYRRASRAL